ncbi:MAG: hypothetical protein U0R26_12035 [Solirubrobacterales bacterium]
MKRLRVRIVSGAALGLVVGLGAFAVVAAGDDASTVEVPSPEELSPGLATGNLARFCEKVPCTFITTDTSPGLRSAQTLKPGGIATPLSECPGAAEVIEAKGYYLPSFGGFDGPCPTPEQRAEIKPYTDRDALIDKLALEAQDGGAADPATLDAIKTMGDE